MAAAPRSQWIARSPARNARRAWPLNSIYKDFPGFVNAFRSKPPILWWSLPRALKQDGLQVYNRPYVNEASASLRARMQAARSVLDR
jgi:hypothetical protein